MRRLIDPLLCRGVQGGTLIVVHPDGQTDRYGDAPQPSVKVAYHDRWLPLRMLANPSLAVGEAYMDGRFDIQEGRLEDLMALGLRLGQPHTLTPLHRGLRAVRKVWQWLALRNPVHRARQNVAHHYDLSDALFDLFLDPDRQYSCAYFTSPRDDLAQAQENKKRHLAAKLALKPGQRVLDIGCGWGGLAHYLAEEADVDVDGLTLSDNQAAYARERARESGLERRLRFRKEDYREIDGPYDRIVSVGMFEHVGKAAYDTFFNRVHDLLRDDGVAVIHSIGQFGRPGPTNPWLEKYIFPGGYTPALSDVMPAVEASGLYVCDIEILRLHYAETLKAWRENFAANRDTVRQMYDERFCRMWEYYLTMAEIGFRAGELMVFQIQLARRQDALPLTRDYITDWERAHGGQAVDPDAADPALVAPPLGGAREAPEREPA